MMVRPSSQAKEQRKAVGLSAVMPQKPAGVRTEPPTSLPIPKAEAFAPTIAPSPEEEPPVVRSVFHGFSESP